MPGGPAVGPLPAAGSSLNAAWRLATLSGAASDARKAVWVSGSIASALNADAAMGGAAGLPEYTALVSLPDNVPVVSPVVLSTVTVYAAAP